MRGGRSAPQLEVRRGVGGADGGKPPPVRGCSGKLKLDTKMWGCCTLKIDNLYTSYNKFVHGGYQ